MSQYTIWMNLNSRLPVAIYSCDIETTSSLLTHGADPNFRSRMGELPICMAHFCPRNAFEIIYILLIHGANPNLINHNGGGNSLFHTLGYPYMVSVECMELLLHNGADPNFQDNQGNTILMLSLRFYKDTCRQLLMLNNGALLFIKNRDGLQPYDIVKNSRNPIKYTIRNYMVQLHLLHAWHHLPPELIRLLLYYL